MKEKNSNKKINGVTSVNRKNYFQIMKIFYTDTGKDEIIEEIRKIKYEIAEEHGFSVSRLVAYLKEKEKSNRMVVSISDFKKRKM